MNNLIKSITPAALILFITAFLFISAVTLGFTTLSWHNQAAILSNSYEMKVKANSGEFDNLWKKIKQSAQVPEQKKEAFKEIFNSYASARKTGGDNQVMTWLQESVPNVDLQTYDQLMNIITGSRDTWTMKQTELVSIAEQHNAMLVSQPRGFVLSLFGHKKIDPKVITSERTEQVFESGKDDDISLN